MSQQFFSEKDVGKIVRRAAELQEKSTGSTAYTPGVSREELERVAREMGIDPTYLEQAVQERVNSATSDGVTLLGVPLTREFEKVIPGELPPEDFDVILDEVSFGRKSQFTSQVGRSLRSTVSSGLGHARMSVSSRDGRTRLRMRSIAIFPGLLTIYPAFLAMVMTATQIAEHAAGTPGWLAPVVATGILAAGWAGFAALARAGHRAVCDLADRIEARIAEATHGLSGPEAATVTESAPEAAAEQELKGS